MDKAKIDKIFLKFPELERFISAGVISLKAARTILGVDRWMMYDLFTELLACGAVNAAGATSWRATQELRDYLEERKAQTNVT